MKQKCRKSSISASCSKPQNLYRIEEEKRNPSNEDEAGDHQEDAASTGDPDEQEKERKAKKRIYPVQNYSDFENMWEKLINIEKTILCPSSCP